MGEQKGPEFGARSAQLKGDAAQLAGARPALAPIKEPEALKLFSGRPAVGSLLASHK
jgi:hypothetical protein